MPGNWCIILDHLNFMIIWDTPRIPLDHFIDELEFILSFLDELLDLATTESLLDILPILFFLADLEPVPRETLHRLTVPFVLRHRLDLLQCLPV